MAISVSDFTNSFSGFFGGDIVKTIMAVVGAGIGLFFVIEMVSRSRRGEVGTWGERSTEREVGFRRFSSQFRQLENLEKELRKREKALRAAETLQESKSSGQSEQKAVQAAEERRRISKPPSSSRRSNCSYQLEDNGSNRRN